MLDGTKIGAYGAGAMKSGNELYLLIRNGRGKMPAYGHAMSDEELGQPFTTSKTSLVKTSLINLLHFIVLLEIHYESCS